MTHCTKNPPFFGGGKNPIFGYIGQMAAAFAEVIKFR